MRAGVSNKGGMIVAVVSVVLAGLTTQLPYAAVAALAVVLAVALGTVAHDYSLGHWAGAHVVYRLVDKHGVTLYIGSTNDLRRRLDEHTDGGGEPWRRRIHAAIEHRLAVSERQARRIEERMIRAVGMGEERAFCLPLHNETWTAPSTDALMNARAWVWMWLYVAQSLVFRGCAWAHPSGVAGRVLLAEHRPDSGSEWDDEEPPDGEPEDVGYRRSPYPPPPPYEMIALGPVTPIPSRDMSEDSDPPLRSRGAHHQDSTDGAGTRARATPRNAQRGNVRTATVKGAHEAATDPTDPAELLAQRRAADAERKRRQRAAAKAAQQP